MRVCRYRLIKTLGEGTFGKVKLAEDMETNEHLAMKIIDKDQVMQKNMGPQVKKEISIMKQLKHTHVIQVKEVLASKTKIFILMEYISHGSLREELVSRGLCKCLPCHACESLQTFAATISHSFTPLLPLSSHQEVDLVRIRHGNIFGR